MAHPNYDSWERRRLTTKQIRLDPHNPRLPLAATDLRQDKIRDYLVTHEDVTGIAKKISVDGFIPFEPIFVVKDGAYFYVVEGNRRICSLQLLLNPEKAPATRQHIFKKYARSVDISSIEKVSVYIAADRASVRKIIYSRHAKSGMKEWGRQQKNRFVANEVILGKTIEEIAKDFEESTSDIYTAVLELLLQEMFADVGLSTEVEEVALSPEFNLSTLSRIVNTEKFKTWTGIQIQGAKLTAALSEKRFKAILNKIVTDLCTEVSKGGQNSRTLDGVDAREKYISCLENIFDQSFDETNDSFVFAPFLTQQNKEGKNVEPRQPRQRKTPEKLIPNNKAYVTGLHKLDIMLEKAQLFPLAAHTVAGSMLLRTILELAVVRMFELHGQLDRAINQRGRTNELSSNLKALVTRNQWFSSEQYRQDLERFSDTKNTQWVCLETLNRYVHGTYNVPDKDTLMIMWGIIEPLIEMCCEKNRMS